MEDLLASIRKAIHEDIGEVPASGAANAGAGFGGSARELRYRVGEEVNAADATLRGQRNRPAVIPEPALTPMRNAGFAEILSGKRQRMAPRLDNIPLPEPPPLRRSIVDADSGIVSRPRDFAPFATEIKPLPPLREPPPILSAEATAAAGNAFERLAEALLNRSGGERALESMTADLLRGMLKQWLDDNLPALVERLVREEIERVSRRGR